MILEITRYEKYKNEKEEKTGEEVIMHLKRIRIVWK